MATRSNIKIVTGETELWIYRHWDGYPEVTGVDVATKLEESKTMTQFVSSLLNDKNERGDHQYEVTTEMHGDIEYLYTIDVDCYMFRNNKNIAVDKVDSYYSDVMEMNRQKKTNQICGTPSQIIRKYSK